jgi:hypothetical protein
MRYLNIVLTVIAVELGWLALTQMAVPVSAQAEPKPTPVVITGIQLQRADAFLPVGVLGQMVGAPNGSRFSAIETNTTVRNQVQVMTAGPIDVRTIAPVKIEADRPIKVEIPVTMSQRPGL